MNTLLVVLNTHKTARQVKVYLNHILSAKPDLCFIRPKPLVKLAQKTKKSKLSALSSTRFVIKGNFYSHFVSKLQTCVYLTSNLPKRGKYLHRVIILKNTFIFRGKLTTIFIHCNFLKGNGKTFSGKKMIFPCKV